MSPDLGKAALLALISRSLSGPGEHPPSGLLAALAPNPCRHRIAEVIRKEIEVASSLTFFSEEEEGLRPPVIYIRIVMDWGLVTCCHGFLMGIMGVEV
ncbi:hypothetical protein NDU88_007456 [Pleurodeles waltl]|uniref:Uncharacterized protein n=1 Tax=Pleurodeles waltl TaxID=8319 RepID=A0AAV7WDJ8_PLEWA|nr:hypothetical protein NDU88_007456 [Pleurodeles waltl]